jgi:16S rRNA (guanine527-N7)-methyltransferase
LSLLEKLASGMMALGLHADQESQQKLMAYLVLLTKWNRVHNLTAVKAPEEMVTLHLLDSLSVMPYVQEGRLLDVGSGAGFPGIVLAIMRPDLQVTTLDSVGKKASFMRQVKAELGIKNLEVVGGRVEAFSPDQKFDMIISRAFSEISDFLRLTQHLIKEGGAWLAMKGVYPHEELAKVQGYESVVHALHVPGLNAQRHLVILKATRQ